MGLYITRGLVSGAKCNFINTSVCQVINTRQITNYAHSLGGNVWLACLKLTPSAIKEPVLIQIDSLEYWETRDGTLSVMLSEQLLF